MKLSLLIIGLLLTFKTPNAFAQACDLAQLETETEVAYKAMTKQLESALAKNENAMVDMSPLLTKVDEYRACQKKTTPKNVDYCSDYSIWADKVLNSNFKMKRRFEVFQSKTGKCLQNTVTMQYVITNKYDLQILYYQNGYYTMTHVIPGKTNSGIPTGRTFLFSDGDLMGNAYAYLIDFPEPLDSYDLSLFWGITVPMNDRMAKLERIFNGHYISFKWSNGAYVTIDSLTEEIVASNFLAPASYKPSCTTVQDVSPKGRTRYSPNYELLSGATQFVGTPYFTQ